MPCKSDAENSPHNSRELYRGTNLRDISDPRILGFYLHNGRYLRKNGAPYGSVKLPFVNVLDPFQSVQHINRGNYRVCFIRLDEILTEENAPPKHFKLTRITVDVGDSEGLQKFGYLLGARGYIQEAVPSDEEHTYEVTLDFLEPILVPPTMLLNLFDDCIATQEGWGEEQGE